MAQTPFSIYGFASCRQDDFGFYLELSKWTQINKGKNL
jgi:hypothetical protein